MSNRLHPYPGLRSFERTETAIFFGREEHIDELVDRLGARHFLAITGSSGSGKSSIAKVGLLAALERGDMDAPHGAWRMAIFRPMDRPFENLAEALLATFDQPRAEHDAARLAGALKRGPAALLEALERLGAGAFNVLLLVDQFEELFTYEELSQETAESFINLLLATLRLARGQEGTGELPVYIALTMRSDFLGRCGEYEGLAEEVNASQYLTPRMTREQIASAIEGPARVCGGTIEPALTNALLNEMGAKQDRLPLLQHALRLLWDGTAPDGAGKRILRYRDYEAMGNLEQALSLHADRIYEGLADERQRELAQHLFRALTAGDTQDTRRPVALSEVMAIAEASLEELRPVVEAFRHRSCSFLLPAGVPLTPERVLDISHESLIRGWQRLREWTRQEQQSAERFQRYLQRAADHAAGRGALLTGADLAVALEWERRERPSLAWAARYGQGQGDLQRVRDYLAASLRREGMERSRQRRARLVGVASALAVVFLGIVGWLWLDADQARRDEVVAREEADRQSANNQQLRAAAEQAQDETLHEYQRYLATFLGGRDREALGDAAWRHLLTLAWPQRLDPRPEVRIPASALDGMPDAYRIELLLSELALDPRLKSAPEIELGSLDTTILEHSFAVDTSGRWLAALVDDRTALAVVDLDSGRAVRFKPDVELASFDALAAAPDGRFLFVEYGRGLVALQPGEALLELSVLPEARAVLHEAEDYSAIFVDQQRQRLLGLDYTGRVAIHPWPLDSSLPRYLDPPGDVAAMPFAAGELWTTEPPVGDPQYWYGLSPYVTRDGALLFAVNGQRELWLWNLVGGGWAARSLHPDVQAFALSDDERTLAIAASTDLGIEIAIYDLRSGIELGTLDQQSLFDQSEALIIEMQLSGTGNELLLRLLGPAGLREAEISLSDGVSLSPTGLWAAAGGLALGVIGQERTLGDTDQAGVYRVVDLSRAEDMTSVVSVSTADGRLAAELARGRGAFTAVRETEGPAAALSLVTTAMREPIDCLSGPILAADIAGSGGPTGTGLLAVLVRDEATGEIRLCLLWEDEGQVISKGFPGTSADPLRQPLLALADDGRQLVLVDDTALQLWTLEAKQGSIRPACAEVKPRLLVEGLALRCQEVDPRLREATALAVSGDGGTVAVALPGEILLWRDQAQASLQRIDLSSEPIDDGGGATVEIAGGGGHALVSAGGKAVLVDLCDRRVVHRFINTGKLFQAGFFPGAEDACSGATRTSRVWLRDTRQFVSRWTLRQQGREASAKAEFEWLLLAEAPSFLAALDHDGSFLVSAPELAIEKGNPVQLPRAAEKLRALVDLLLVTAPFSLPADESVFRLPAAERPVIPETGARQEGPAVACLRLTDEALAEPPMARSEEAAVPCEEVVRGAAVPVAIGTAYGRLLMHQGFLDHAEELLLLAAAAGDRAALWNLAWLYQRRDELDVAAAIRAAADAADPTVAYVSGRGLLPEAVAPAALAEVEARAESGDALALVAIGRRAMKRWRDMSGASAARQAVWALSMAMLALRHVPDQDTVELQKSLYRERGEAASAAGRDLLADALQETLDDTEAQRNAQAASGATFVYPADPAARAAALLEAARRLAGNEALAPAFTGFWVARLLQAPPPEQSPQVRAQLAELLSWLASDYAKAALLRGQVDPDDLLARLTALNRISGDGIDPPALLIERLLAWLQDDDATDGGSAQFDAEQARGFLRLAVAVQRLAADSGRTELAKSTLPPLLRWLQAGSTGGYAFAIDGDTMSDLVDELRLVADTGGDAELEAMGEAFVFALLGWSGSGSYDEEVARTRSLAAKLRTLSGPGRRVAELIASRSFGAEESLRAYEPFWPEGAGAGIYWAIADDMLDLVFVLEWAAQRQPAWPLLTGLGNAHSQRAWAIGTYAQSTQEWALAAEAHREAARAFERALRLDPDHSDYATYEFERAVEIFVDVGLLAEARDSLDELLAFQAYPDKDETFDSINTAYIALLTLPDAVLPAGDLLGLLERVDRQAVRKAGWPIPQSQTRYLRSWTLLHLLIYAAWQDGALPAEAADKGSAAPCDYWAAAAYDPYRVDDSVGLVEPWAVDDCRAALAEDPSNPRLRVQLARALLDTDVSPDDAAIEEGLRLYVEAARQGYPAAFAALAAREAASWNWDPAADFAAAAEDRVLLPLGVPLALQSLASGDADGIGAAGRLLRGALELGDAEAALRLAEALDAAVLQAEQPDEAYRAALIAARRFAAELDLRGGLAAHALATRLGEALDPALRAAALAAAKAFRPRDPAQPDLDALLAPG